MYWCIDGFWTCRDLGCASSAGFRRPWVPPHGIQKTADVALLGTYVPQLGLQVLQLSLSGTPGEALEALKPHKIQVFY